MHSMLEKSYYLLPKKSGDIHYLGRLIGASLAVECADIIERHAGLVILITQDMHNALQLRDEIQQFSKHCVTIFSDWKTLPYDSFPQNKKIISDRLANLYLLPTLKKGLFIFPVYALMKKVFHSDFLTTNALVLHKGERLAHGALRDNLEKAGYQHVLEVHENGEYSTSGALLDIFPIGAINPYRIKFFNDIIDSLKIFDVDSQLTVSEVDRIHLLPAHEFPTDDEAIELFCSQWRKNFDVRMEPEYIYQQIRKKILPSGIEFWQPLFFNYPLSSLFNYFPANALLIMQDVASAIDKFCAETYKRYEIRKVDPMRPLLPPNTLWLDSKQFNLSLKYWPCIILSVDAIEEKAGYTNLPYYSVPDVNINCKSKATLDKLDKFIKSFSGKIVFSVKTAERREIAQELLASINIYPTFITSFNELRTPGFYIIIGPSEQGFINQDQQIVLICERDLFGNRVLHSENNQCTTINTNSFIRHLEELWPGKLVVHLEYGVGCYQGLIILDTGGIQAEYLMLTYAGNDKLYVPISSLNLIRAYRGINDKSTPLHKLGSNIWDKEKQKATKKISDIAAKLLDIYAQRAIKPGFTFKNDMIKYRLFCQDCPFATTIDQEQAIQAVFSDMSRPITMNRLICGDAGFGKTEVAMRAAFLAIINNQQVAVLVPTTLLAQQHFENFRERFANWPVRIKMLSRFCSVKEQKKIINEVVEGKTHILIGTHTLLQKHFRWKALGLLIIDEEHRFGVRHKELIQSIKANVDILMLTATPIPRTLHMAMIGIRDLSIISTPPARRLPVKTFVRQYDDCIVSEAILREISRGGQVYYLFNDVKYIQKAKDRLEAIVPNARFMIGHGQMRARELERVMIDFHYQRFNVLICTTIIETGIDIPNVNTIIIERADHFGLAQLHQLRGRVGRSYRQAYAYLLTSNSKAVTADAHKRLEAIAALEDLGAGFALAAHDLEMRGAGASLSDEQSGQIITIGLSLYVELLTQAVADLQKGKELSLEELTGQQIEIDLKMPVLLPDNYISNANIRLSFYKRIASAKNNHELDELKNELVDRFGELPIEGMQLLQSNAMRIQAKALGIQRIEAHEKGGFIKFSTCNAINKAFLITLLQNSPDIYRLDKNNKLKFIKSLINYSERITFVSHLINDLQLHESCLL